MFGQRVMVRVIMYRVTDPLIAGTDPHWERIPVPVRSLPMR